MKVPMTMKYEKAEDNQIYTSNRELQRATNCEQFQHNVQFCTDHKLYLICGEIAMAKVPTGNSLEINSYTPGNIKMERAKNTSNKN